MQLEKNFAIAAIQRRSRLWGMIETVLLTLLFIWLGRMFRPNDPFYLSGPIPWVAFAPILCSLFYGTFKGALSLSILVGLLIWHQPTPILESLPIREYIAGISTITLLTGIFSSYWFSRILHVEHLNLYVREHLEALSREYYMLRVSHDRLEYAYIAKPTSMRDVFYQIQQNMQHSQNPLSPEAGQKLLGLFTQFCSINSAVFCEYHTRMQQPHLIAHLGENFQIDLDDPLLKKALKEKVTAYTSISEIELRYKSQYLAVIPLLNTDMEYMGFIVIKDMGFWGLTHDNLEVLSVLAAYFAIQFSAVQTAENCLRSFPECPAQFAQELERMVYLWKYYKVKSSLICLVVPEITEQNNIIYSLQQQKRSLDCTWIFSPTVTQKSAKFFITLMPLTSMEGINGYYTRLTSWLKHTFSQDIQQNGFHFRSHPLNKESAVNQLKQFLIEVNDALE